MLRENPSGAELLEAARTVLRDEILPHVPAEQRYQALMVANAMAIAARQMGAESPDLDEARRLLAGVYDTPGADLEALAARLATDLRAGRFDDTESPEHAAVRAALDALTRAKLAESNPKAL